jgi:hypothetical protein
MYTHDKPIKIQFLIKDPKSPMDIVLYGDMQKLGIVIILRSIENSHQRGNLKLKFWKSLNPLEIKNSIVKNAVF